MALFWVKMVVTMATILCPIRGQDLPAINPDNLDPSAAHVCENTTQETYTERQSYTQYYTQKTNTWCLNIPPRCTEYRIAARTSYRVVTKYRERKAYFCCDGYKSKTGLSYCIPKCQFDCYASERHGVCVTPGNCLCHQGYKGQYCESGCGDNQWGPNCANTCNCGTYGSCDPENGNCICSIGYTGTDCSRPCVDSFGLHCVNPCVCENNATCNNVNGKCTCQPGYFGEYCHRKCDLTSVGELGCEQTCPCQNGGTCDDVTGDCVCPAGYMGEYCTVQCDGYHYGLNCSKQCQCNQGTCDPITGACTCDFGWAGTRCEIECRVNNYGPDCGTVCRCQNGGRCYPNSQDEIVCNCTNTGYHGLDCNIRDCPYNERLNTDSGACESCDCRWTNTDSCHVLTGACECEPGYHGDRCTLECAMPFYGVNCSQLCTCKNGLCHHVSGECTTCYAGYTGSNCDQSCPRGKWGIGCSNNCLCNMNNGDCHASSGYCNCSAGFQGLFCEQPCAVDKYGPGCIHDCSCNLTTAICSPYDGSCLCRPGYHGDQCSTPCNPGTYGHLCRHTCSCDSQGSDGCDPQTGQCVCLPGYSGVTCGSPCKMDAWGPYCMRACDCSGHGSCDHTTGACLCGPGYTGEACEHKCPQGFYGLNCSATCRECTYGTVCDYATGECVGKTCPPGFTGTNCQDLCPRGTWGSNCASQCAATCVQNGFCNPVNGYCQCFPGYYGTQCDQMCPAGKFGYGCVNDCPCKPEHTERCEPVSGKCQCKNGRTGAFCEKECSSDTWGPNCMLACSSVCSAANSVGCDSVRGLPCTCRAGYEGQTCAVASGVSVIGEQTGNSNAQIASATNLPIIIASVIVAVVLLAIIACLVMYFSRRIRKLKDDNLNVLYQANGAGSLASRSMDNSIGVTNPTYVEENRRNEESRRFPHLTSASIRNHRNPPLPQRPPAETFDDIAARKYPHLSQRRLNSSNDQSDHDGAVASAKGCDDSFDETTSEKLRVAMTSEVQCPASGSYLDTEEDRYTTLKAMQVAAANNRDSDGIGNDYVLYTGAQSESQRSHPGSQSGNQTQGTHQHNTSGFSQPLYGFDMSKNSNEDSPYHDSAEMDQSERSECSSPVAEGFFHQTADFQGNVDSENPYDIPSNPPASKMSTNENDSSPQLPTPNNGYLTPSGDSGFNMESKNSTNPFYDNFVFNSDENGQNIQTDTNAENVSFEGVTLETHQADLDLGQITLEGNDASKMSGPQGMDSTA